MLDIFGRSIRCFVLPVAQRENRWNILECHECLIFQRQNPPSLPFKVFSSYRQLRDIHNGSVLSRTTGDVGQWLSTTISVICAALVYVNVLDVINVCNFKRLKWLRAAFT